jgi:hypothetical protein
MNRVITSFSYALNNLLLLALCVTALTLTSGRAISSNEIGAAQPILLAAADTNRLLVIPGIATPDSLISKAIQDIRASRLDDALKEVNRAIALRPDFKLAHLIRGDLLMARSRPLAGLGAVAKAPNQPLDDLRDEARVRLMRYIDQPDCRFAAAPDSSTCPQSTICIAGRHIARALVPVRKYRWRTATEIGFLHDHR